MVPMARFVRYGPAPRYGLPDAGFCASSFVLVRRGANVLAGIPRDQRRWRTQWQPNIDAYTPAAQEAEFRSWRLPASFLFEGEHPADTARRVMRDQLQVPVRRLAAPEVHAFHDPSSWYPGHRHYDLCFVYEVRGIAPRAIPPWWQRLEFVEPRFLRSQDLGSAMSDLVRKLHL